MKDTYGPAFDGTAINTLQLQSANGEPGASYLAYSPSCSLAPSSLRGPKAAKCSRLAFLQG